MLYSIEAVSVNASGRRRLADVPSSLRHLVQRPRKSGCVFMGISEEGVRRINLSAHIASAPQQSFLLVVTEIKAY